MLIYGTVSVVIALMFNVLWAYAYRRGLVAGVAGEGGLRVSLGFLTGPLAYLAGTLIALINPFISMAIFFGLAIYWMLPGRIPSGSG